MGKRFENGFQIVDGIDIPRDPRIRAKMPFSREIRYSGLEVPIASAYLLNLLGTRYRMG